MACWDEIVKGVPCFGGGRGWDWLRRRGKEEPGRGDCMHGAAGTRVSPLSMRGAAFLD